MQLKPMLGVIDGYAQVAQSVEHVLGKDEVGGSIPLLGFCPDWNCRPENNTRG